MILRRSFLSLHSKQKLVGFSSKHLNNHSFMDGWMECVCSHAGWALTVKYNFGSSQFPGAANPPPTACRLHQPLELQRTALQTSNWTLIQTQLHILNHFWSSLHHSQCSYNSCQIQIEDHETRIMIRKSSVSKSATEMLAATSILALCMFLFPRRGIQNLRCFFITKDKFQTSSNSLSLHCSIWKTFTPRLTFRNAQGHQICYYAC